MAYKFFLRAQILGLLVLAVALGHDLAGEFLTAETLYPVEAETALIAVAEAPAPHQIAKTELAPAPLLVRSASANPFVPVLDLSDVPKIAKPQTSREALLAAALDTRIAKISAFAQTAAGPAADELTHCKALVEQTLRALPNELTASLDDLTLFFSNRNPRGLSNSHVLELRCAGLSDSEIVSVLVHELGHVTDLGAFTGNSPNPSGFRDGHIVIRADDASAKFYALSWTDEKTKKFSANRLDFVSGYASTDPFEDFAESFDFYILHGTDFRMLAGESKVLQAKYDFLKNQVFAGQEFNSAVASKANKRAWDTTLLEFNLAAFLGESQPVLARR
jgi:hypothetical protein